MVSVGQTKVFSVKMVLEDKDCVDDPIVRTFYD